MPIPSPTQLTTFSSLPLSGDSSSPSPPETVPDHQTNQDTYLFATIKSNLTITKPTLILTDSASQDFALVFDPPSAVVSSGPYTPDAVADKFKQLGLKKGNTVIIKNARRTTKKAAGREEGQGFVVLRSLGRLATEPEGGLRGKGGDGDREGKEGEAELLGVVPSALFLTRVMMDILRQRDESLPGDREEKMCDGKFDRCVTPRGKEEGGDGSERGLKRCQGCVEVWYCSKECQTRRWIAHKSECKTIKALRGIWPRPEGVE
ncbi:hypothetical protein NEUTE1DRAFT_143752 [Neurospora tetrasperma FGSC 2508]|uniref:MYND-type domain-containing protein n=1 Tax=Neurospora tetrasperma (strain FGSC 2508 / ATCC MYA-4615 / P0657) TaxID=510951 RepID=F8MBI5_NEUT8|nr:uncharacterized protein NEUTE1DRAFT_143752 [Neurospora tetrasperma FGSC 2508]EGO60297.1 hypothetical protein NEUTE1DRAFT_143752 [Neurospora tetrasperma FGSC 2508]EGZ75737.1 hypothetical protein NEUTE2DRAFT_156134 [Neurospora tetrasperma FGSC 2509]